MKNNVKKQNSYTEKYNSLYDRTEYFDLYGNIFAYSRKNTSQHSIEFYKANGAFIKSNMIKN
jgi:hypothetical protein